MPACISCLDWGNDVLCSRCHGQLRPAVGMAVGGMCVVSAYTHESVARRLVHMFKYQGIRQAGVLLAKAMSATLPTDCNALVPVPRALVRRIRYGSDPAAQLARMVASEVGLPVVNGLRAQLWWPAHAGSNRLSRKAPVFGMAKEVPAGSVLIDDVLTTGATLAAAGAVHGIESALTATRAGIDRYG